MAPRKGKAFEDNMKRLEEIVQALEAPEVSLEQGITLYKEGAQCVKLCREQLEKARQELKVWQVEGQDDGGSGLAEPVDDEDDDPGSLMEDVPF